MQAHVLICKLRPGNEKYTYRRPHDAAVQEEFNPAGQEVKLWRRLNLSGAEQSCDNGLSRTKLIKTYGTVGKN